MRPLFRRPGNRKAGPLSFSKQLSKKELGKWEKEAPLYEPVSRSTANQESRYAFREEGVYEAQFEGETGRVTIVCAGDILCEERLHASHLDPRGGFEFDSVYQFVRPVIRNCDLAIANLETNICESSPYTGEQYKIGGKYHCNAPVEFLDAIKRVGFDFLMLANNHSLDSGVSGAMETLCRIDERKMMRTGLFSVEERQRGTVLLVNGIRIGLLSYSTWYNRNEGRLTDEGRRQIINEYSQEKVRRDVSVLRERGAEFVLAYMHWGTDAEYKRRQSARMEAFAKEVADAGVDYLIGSHTHSVQPYTLIEADDGRIVPCVYSLGNFVTSERSSVSRDSVILKICLQKTEGVVSVSSESFIPCHVPDEVLGVGFPVIPEDAGCGDTAALASCREGFSLTKKTIGYEAAKRGVGFVLTKAKLCSMLGLPEPEEDETYSSVRFAKDSIRNCVAVISDITSDPHHRTSPQRCRELAEFALDQGARLLISAHQIEDCPCLIVPDVFAAYCTVISSIRRRFSPRTISVTGSIGKTSTTEMVRSVIKSKHDRTHFNTGSANNVRYCGTVVQQLKTGHEYYVQELMEGPPYGAASTISKMVQPHASIVTVVGTSHLEHFGTQERILESCLGVQDGMPDNGLLILNGDDSFQWEARTKLHAVYYGIDNEKVDYRAVNIRGEGCELKFDVVYEGRTVPASIRCFGRHNVLNALAAFVAGKWAEMRDDEVVRGLASYRTTGIRQNLVTWGGYSLYLDCYNSSRESVDSALDALSMMDISSSGRRIAVLADVKEAGDEWKEIHEGIGCAVADSCADVLLCYGDGARFIAQAAQESGMDCVYHAQTIEDLVDLICQHVRPDDIALFKGSHGMALEDVVDKVWGTWYHEEFERYDFLTRVSRDSDFEYRIYTDHAVVVKKLSSCASAVVPDEVEGLPVTGVAESVFNRSKYTESVELSRNLRNIRYCAFYKANKITRVEIPASVRIIHTSAFSTCDNLREVVIEPGCMHIGYRAFGNCVNLERIVVPETVRQIESEAFLNCGSLTVCGVPGSYAEAYATSIGVAFEACVDSEGLSHTAVPAVGVDERDPCSG